MEGKLAGVIGNIAEIDETLMSKAQERLDNLTKPQGSLGRLEELAKRVVGITGKMVPSYKNKVVFTFAADHGVAEEGVSAYPKEVTAQMVYNFLAGGAAINVLARHVGARVVVADIGVSSKLGTHPNLVVKKVNYGTKNMAKEPAMTKAEAVKSIESGIEIFEEEYKKRGVDIAGTGDMGIGNTTASSAITAVLADLPVEDVVGRGTGIDDKSLKNKVEAIKRAIKLSRPDRQDPIDVLAKVGGFEIGGLAGVILAAAARKTPTIIDGFISGAAALIAYSLQPMVKDYMIAAHCSVEKGHRRILDHIGLPLLMDLNMRLGEGTGAALGMSLVEASIRIMTEMATFKGAGVSRKK